MIQVIVPFYNCLPWIARSLYSLQVQEGCQYRVLVTDDCSTDGSGEIAKALCEAYGFEYRKTAVNVKCPRNIVEAIDSLHLAPETIIYLVDGDDYLTHPRSLKQVHDAYDADPNLWMAYGKYESVPFDGGCQAAGPYPDYVVSKRAFRAYPFNMFNHPLTFKAWFFDRVDRSAFMTKDGSEWLTTGYDRAFMWPMLEMATHDDGRCFYKCLPDVVYSYNSINSNSETPQGMSIADSEYLVDQPSVPFVWK